MNRSYRTRHATGVPSWGPTPGWDQPLPGWNPLVDHGSPTLRVAGSVARWWWPTLAVAGFLAVVVYVTGHDHPDPSPSNRGLLTIALAAVVVVLLAALLALTGSVDQSPTNPATPAAKSEAKQAATANQKVDAGEDRRPGVLRIAAGVARAVTGAIRAIIRAARWVADLWRQADAKTDHPDHSPSTTTPQGKAMAPSPAVASTSTRRLL